jgi:uncharacterized SAM-binding protein YcdF (DUF218 family)
VGDVARIAVAGAVGATALATFAGFRIWQEAERNDVPRTADAIVVLGASQEHGRPLAVLRARLDHAIELYGTGLAKFFVVTGGTAEGDVLSEAEAARRYAVERGVPANAILAETMGHDTFSSLQGVQRLFQAQGVGRAVFVSDSTHMFRVLRMARDLGMDAHGSPTTTSPIDRDPLTRALAVFHELLALADYLFLAG